MSDNHALTFGKYKGQSRIYVIATNPRYALWAHANVAGFRLSPAEIQLCVFKASMPPSVEGDDDMESLYPEFGNN